jgi:hypothetical protein
MTRVRNVCRILFRKYQGRFGYKSENNMMVVQGWRGLHFFRKYLCTTTLIMACNPLHLHIQGSTRRHQDMSLQGQNWNVSANFHWKRKWNKLNIYLDQMQSSEKRSYHILAWMAGAPRFLKIMKKLLIDHMFKFSWRLWMLSWRPTFLREKIIENDSAIKVWSLLCNSVHYYHGQKPICC